MKLGQSFRGPRIGTKLALLGMALLIVPWFSYVQLLEMEKLLIQGQSQAQLLTAEGISTLFNGREDLFDDLPVELEDYESLFAHPLQSTIRLDGNASDWGEDILDEYLAFGSPNGLADSDFELLLGERAGTLYGHLRIRDSQLVYRDPEVLRLDNADHLRLDFIRADGEDGRIALVLEDPNSITGFEMDEEWAFAATGSPVSGIQGTVTSQSGELWVEFRFPLALLGSRRYFGITFVDVDDPVGREIVRQTQTLPTAGKQSFNLVVLRTPEVRNIVQGLGYSGARILVIDSQKRVRAEVGTIQQSTDEEPRDFWYTEILEVFDALRPWIHAMVTGESYESRVGAAADPTAADRAIDASLDGDPIALRSSSGDAQEIIFAAHPIVSADAVIGSVVVEQNIDDILSFQRQAFEEVILLSLLSLFAVFVLLIAFAGRLAWRIRSLRREASAAIDSHGRLRTSELQSEMDAGDEIGDLARSVSNMLSKLHQHNTFLESMPRTLRHEINNPLNTLSTSLQNLAQEYPDVDDSKYLESAKRGVHRIGSIVQNLADAANLEESLEAEELELVDLNLLLENYVANCKLSHAGCSFTYRGPNRPVLAMVSDFRIEQMMDKIVDNAIDFHRRDTPIKVQLDTFRDTLQITVANRGPVLPEAVQNSVFDSMVSHRGQQNRLHFGLGLYVVRVIAEYHGGVVRAMNLTDGSGVAMMVQLPLAEGQPGAVRALDPIAGERVSAG
jgi:dedicated sortase system histidine kinase